MVSLVLNLGGPRLHVIVLQIYKMSLKEIPGSRLYLRPLLASLRTAAPDDEIPRPVPLVLLTEL